MKVKKISIPLLLMISLFIGCSNQSNIVDGQLIHDEQRSLEFGEKIEIAYDENYFQTLWKSFNFTVDSPNVSFDRSAVLFAQTYENSCPKNIKKFEINEKRNILIIDTMQKKSECNDIGIPRTFVFQIDAEKLEELESIQFEGEMISLDDQ